MATTEKNANSFDMTSLTAVNSGYSLMLINNSTNEGQLIRMTDLATMILNEDQIPDDITDRIDSLENRIAGITGGVPTVVSSTSEMTDTDKIYILSTDGKWYYHDGSTWVAGGEYGGVAAGSITTDKLTDGAVTAAKIASGVIPAVDATLAQTGAAADAKKTGDELADLKSTLDLSTPYNAYLASILCPDSSQFKYGRRIQKNGFTVSIQWMSSNANKLLWFFTGNEPLIVTDFETVASTIPTSDQIMPIGGLKKLPLDLVYYIDSKYEGTTRSQLFVHYLSVSEDEIETIEVVGITTSTMTNQKGLNVYEFNVPDGATHFALSYYSAGAGAAATVTLGLERNYSDEIAKLQALALENA